VVVEVAVNDRLEPLPGLRHRIVHSPTELLLDFLQLRPHALADRLAPYRERPAPVLPAHVRMSRPGEFHPEAEWARELHPSPSQIRA